MKRSTQVGAPLLAATALAMTAGCHRPAMQRCVDDKDRVVADSLCGPQRQQPLSGGQSGGHGGGFGYRYYYGGSGGSEPGSSVSGGSLAPTPGVSYSTSTARGGFGSTLGGESGGHSGEGGHAGGAGE